MIDIINCDWFFMNTYLCPTIHYGGRAIGVMPNMLNEREITSQKLTELILVDSMHERKYKMAELADAFVMAPGGAGSLEEFFEMYSWAQIGTYLCPTIHFEKLF